MSEPGDGENWTGLNYRLGSNTWTMPKSSNYLRALRELQTMRLEPWETWQRLYRPSSAGVGHITMVEPFSSKQKERDEVYKYFSPTESQRGTGNALDPAYYEANILLERSRVKPRWAWCVGDQKWVLVERDTWLKLQEPQENEFGVVCP